MDTPLCPDRLCYFLHNVPALSHHRRIIRPWYQHALPCLSRHIRNNWENLPPRREFGVWEEQQGR